MTVNIKREMIAPIKLVMADHVLYIIVAMGNANKSSADKQAASTSIQPLV
ncbi:MAG TPA: hypothetical protein PK337_07480 [Bacteroidia bacterium]|nr:hypothetical protein [Bacteroidia bacterium]HPA31530.1 hypothetical protein [Bacteroidia bacterium]HQO87127.1 hypothetical protein [Bacteroidia bacterium]HQP02124.1 hypothetical protein [Bacteroidia bacterium]HRE24859.1 hypothetical protein [Bacteroidia bacterium]